MTESHEGIGSRYEVEHRNFSRTERKEPLRLQRRRISRKAKQKKEKKVKETKLTNRRRNGNQACRIVMTRNLRAVEKMTLKARASSLESSVSALKV